MIAIALAAALIVPPVPVMGPVPIDPRCQYTSAALIPRHPPRAPYLLGEIIRSDFAKSMFVRMNPCPTTGLRFGSCPEFHVDHIVPISNGGADEPKNMQWLHISIKSCPASSGRVCKDQFERKIYRCWQ